MSLQIQSKPTWLQWQDGQHDFTQWSNIVWEQGCI